MEEASVDNFCCSDGELDFWDKDLFGSLAMGLDNFKENFGIVELGIDKLEGVLGSSITH